MNKNLYVGLSFLLALLGFGLLVFVGAFEFGALACIGSLIVVIGLMLTGNLKTFG